MPEIGVRGPVSPWDRDPRAGDFSDSCGAEADPSDSFEPGALLRFIAPIIGVAKHCVKMTHVFAGVGRLFFDPLVRELRFLKFRLMSRIYRPKMVRGRIIVRS